LAGTLSASGGEAKAPSKSNAAIITAAKSAIAEDLKDPDSVRFRNVVVHDAPDHSYYMVCGEMNSKNSFGGYTGYSQFLTFVTDQKEVVMKVIGDEEAKAIVVRDKCGKPPRSPSSGID
jgi:hypothetical protein